MRFSDRTDAGRKLGVALQEYGRVEDAVVLALPRGGVLVGFAVAEEINAPLDVLVVRKVGVPGHEELAMGAVAGGGVTVRNEDILRELRIPEAMFDHAAEQQRREVARREELYRGDRPPLELADRTVILVDDGLATGASMKAAVGAVRQCQPKLLVVAVPVAAHSTAEEFRLAVARLVCIHEPTFLDGVGRWYDDFRQISDAEVRQLLEEASQRHPAAGR